MKVYVLLINQRNSFIYEQNSTSEIGRVFATMEEAKKYCEDLRMYEDMTDYRRNFPMASWALKSHDEFPERVSFYYDRKKDEYDEIHDTNAREMCIDIVERSLVTDENPLYKIEIIKEETK